MAFVRKEAKKKVEKIQKENVDSHFARVKGERYPENAP